MSEASRKDLDSAGSLIALVAAATGAAIELIALAGFFIRNAPVPDDPSLVIVDAVVALLALLGVGQMIKRPNAGAPILAGAGVASILSDMVGLLTPPRMIPGGLMIFSAVVIFGTRKDSIEPGTGDQTEETVAEPAVAAPTAEATEAPHWLPVLVLVALGLHVAGGGFIGLGAGLLAPPVGVLAGWLIWAFILYAGIRLRKTKPWYAVATPFLGVGAWVLLLTGGSALFGWTA